MEFYEEQMWESLRVAVVRARKANHHILRANKRAEIFYTMQAVWRDRFMHEARNWKRLIGRHPLPEGTRSPGEVVQLCLGMLYNPDDSIANKRYMCNAVSEAHREGLINYHEMLNTMHCIKIALDKQFPYSHASTLGSRIVEQIMKNSTWSGDRKALTEDKLKFWKKFIIEWS